MLGMMTFGTAWGWGAAPDECKRMFDRNHFVVATKYTLTKRDSTDPNSGGNSRKNMTQSVERSLKRLQTDFIDRLYLHMRE